MGLRKGPHVVVGTCGRVADMMKRNALNVENVNMLVMDEADELLGPTKDVVYDIFTALPATAQAVLVSSTFSKETHDLWVKFMRDPVLYLVKRDRMVIDNFTNLRILARREEEKENILYDALETKLSGAAQTIIFCNTKRKVEWLSDKMTRNNYRCATLHGDITQNERDLIYNSFASGDYRILVTTSQFARGLNIVGVGGIVQYDMPSNAIEFYHRLGRSGRFGRQGKCISITLPSDELCVKAIEKYFSIQLKVVN